jgi:hypothetical protein
MKAELQTASRNDSAAWHVISVPGTVDAWAELHKKFGKLKLRTISPRQFVMLRRFSGDRMIAYYRALVRGSQRRPGAF